MKNQITLFTFRIFSFLILLSLILVSFTAKSQEESAFKFKKRQFMSGINLSYLSDLNEVNSSLTVTNGFIFNNRIGVNLGLGLERGYSGPRLPITVEGRYLFFNKKSHSPFLTIMGGYIQPLNRNNSYYSRKGGLTSGAQIGYQNFFGDHVGLSTSIGYRFNYQENNNMYYPMYELSSIYYPVMQFNEYHAIEVKVAILLK